MIKFGNGIEIRTFRIDLDDIDQLTHVLNTAYKQLADMGLKYLASHQKSDITYERIKDAYCLIALKENSIVRTISYYSPGIKDGTRWYEREGVGVFGQFGVLPKFQSTGIGSALIELIEKKAADEGVEELALDTAEQAIHLINYYSKRGYRFIEYTSWDVTNYRSVIMSKKLQ